MKATLKKVLRSADFITILSVIISIYLLVVLIFSLVGLPEEVVQWGGNTKDLQRQIFKAVASLLAPSLLIMYGAILRLRLKSISFKTLKIAVYLPFFFTLFLETIFAILSTVAYITPILVPNPSYGVEMEGLFVLGGYVLSLVLIILPILIKPLIGIVSIVISVYSLFKVKKKSLVLYTLIYGILFLIGWWIKFKSTTGSF